MRGSVYTPVPELVTAATPTVHRLSFYSMLGLYIAIPPLESLDTICTLLSSSLPLHTSPSSLLSPHSDVYTPLVPNGL